MKTLYLSDLDGTLLRSDQTVSEFTYNTINSLTENGMIFSYATARSLVTAKKVTRGLSAKIPLIVYNGAFINDNRTGDIIAANFFDGSVYDVLGGLIKNGVYPIVYAYIDGAEKFSFVPELCSEGTLRFLESRKDDIRTNAVKSISELTAGDIFYISCIYEPQKLGPLYEKYKSLYNCMYQADIYTGDTWLEVMPKNVSKANAALQLKELLRCGRITAFGDGINDIDLFRIADECYAVENANDELKKYADGVIPSNDEDGVAKWLIRNFK